MDFSPPFVSSSFITEDPMPSLRVPGLVTERAFEFVDGVKRFLISHRCRPPETPFWVESDGVKVPWYEILPGYAELVEKYALLQGASTDPVQNKRVPDASGRVNVGSAVLLHRYFTENMSSPRPKILIVGSGNGVDFQRMMLARRQRTIALIDTVDVADTHAVSIKAARENVGVPGRDYFCDVISEDSPLNCDGYYDLVYAHNSIHQVVCTEDRMGRFFSLLRRALAPGGVCIGTYPEGTQCEVIDGRGSFKKLRMEEPTAAREWGSVRVSLGRRIWHDPIIPLHALSGAASGAGLALETWLLPETNILHRKYVPARMSDFVLYPELGYFRAFSFSASEAHSSAPGEFPPEFILQRATQVPMALEMEDYGVNYGAPLSSDDIPWILHSETYVKTKENGTLGVIVATDGQLFLKTRAGDVGVFHGVVTREPWVVQVEILPGKRYMLSDPLVVPGLPKAAPFHARLKGWVAYRDSCIAARLVETGTWLPSSPANVRAVWEASEEGVIFQYMGALAVTYRNSGDVRGSMRYVKRIPTVDVGPRCSISVKFAGTEYSIDNPHHDVREFALTNSGPIFTRVRPDKTIGNNTIQLSRMERLVPLQGVLDILASKAFRAPSIHTPLPESPSPLEQATLLLHTGNFSGQVRHILQAKRVQAALRLQLAEGTLSSEVAEILTSFGWEWSSLLFRKEDISHFAPPPSSADGLSPLDFLAEYTMSPGASTMFVPALAPLTTRAGDAIIAGGLSTQKK